MMNRREGSQDITSKIMEDTKASAPSWQEGAATSMRAIPPEPPTLPEMPERPVTQDEKRARPESLTITGILKHIMRRK